ncbi:hypothetical protein JB92DRAFT_3016748 [Gautieria morchelliformis]|nr:hypothetical protein JB92DRAFT_3016748 [Gautieria morchelliformis]
MTPTRNQTQGDVAQPTYNISLYDIWRPFPALLAGQAAYEKAITEWKKQFEGTRAMLENPLPLRPGGSYLDGLECFQCRLKGHLSRDCQEPPERRVPPEEREWRADYAAIRNQQRQTQRPTMIAHVEEGQGNGVEPSG